MPRSTIVKQVQFGLQYGQQFGKEVALFDVIIIGGGVNGAGVARDAAGRGAKVLLLEQGDLAQGTSSASSKLIHGGLRYLEHYEFGLVRKALGEREVLWKIAPHIIWPMRFVLPYQKGLRPRWLLRLGLFLYDYIGARKLLPPANSVDLRSHPAGAALDGKLTRGFEYSDCWADDARLVVLNAMDAAAHGATIRTQTAVTRCVRTDDGWTVVTSTGETFSAAVIVNAAGPWTIDLLDKAGISSPRKMRPVAGSHIVVRKLFDHPYAYFFQLPDGRIFFAIPYEHSFTLIGTTEREYAGDPAAVFATEQEVAYLCDGANQYFATQISPVDVLWSYAGIRPLVDDGSGRPDAATRGYEIELDQANPHARMLTIFGGKLSSYRQIAEEVTDQLARLVPAMNSPRWTGERPLPGGDFAVAGAESLKAEYAANFPFLEPDQASRITKAYGTLAKAWLGDAQSRADLGLDFGHGLSAAEVDYLVEHEWARSAQDILWRRSKLGLHFTAEQAIALDDYLQAKLAAAST